MVDPSADEIAAMEAAAGPAGEHIESIGKTDLATFEPDEFMNLIEVIVTAYHDTLTARLREKLDALEQARGNKVRGAS